MRTKATDLKNGNVFEFQGDEFTCLSAYYDNRTVSVFVTTIRGEDWKNVFVLHLFHHFYVNVIRRRGDMNLQVRHNTHEEIGQAEDAYNGQR